MIVHANNHADPADACQLNGVRVKAVSVPFPKTLADVDLWNIPVSWLSSPIDVKTGDDWQVFGERLPSSELHAGRRQAEHAGHHWANVQELLPSRVSAELLHRQKAWLKILLAVTALLCLYRLFRFLSSQESSFLGCDKQRMDDGGRRGNAPPNAPRQNLKNEGMAA